MTERYISLSVRDSALEAKKRAEDSVMEKRMRKVRNFLPAPAAARAGNPRGTAMPCIAVSSL